MQARDRSQLRLTDWRSPCLAFPIMLVAGRSIEQPSSQSRYSCGQRIPRHARRCRTARDLGFDLASESVRAACLGANKSTVRSRVARITRTRRRRRWRWGSNKDRCPCSRDWQRSAHCAHQAIQAETDRMERTTSGRHTFNPGSASRCSNRVRTRSNRAGAGSD